MTVLRDLRMRQAADQLASDTLSLDQVAGHAGYDSRSSFVRAFRKAYGCDPTDYRNTRYERPGPIRLRRGESQTEPGSSSYLRPDKRSPAPTVSQLPHLSRTPHQA